MTKERLEAYRALKMEQEQLCEFLKAQEDTPTSSDLAQQCRTQYENFVDVISAEQLAIEAAIESLDPIYRVILRYKFIDGLTLERLADKINYSTTQTKRLCRAALKQLEDKTED